MSIHVDYKAQRPSSSIPPACVAKAVNSNMELRALNVNFPQTFMALWGPDFQPCSLNIILKGMVSRYLRISDCVIAQYERPHH